MARTGVSTTLAEMKQVVEQMRALGVSSWNGSPVGDITLGAKPPVEGTPPKERSVKEQRREHYELTFNRPVTDAELKNLP